MNVCQLVECQTTAGCAHRGPHGEYCYFTAAAQVGEDTISDLTTGGKPTAQVGEPDRLKAVEAAYVHASDEIERLDDQTNTTIERCAQVAEKYVEKDKWVRSATAKDIAAAIRKLKDEA